MPLNQKRYRYILSLALAGLVVVWVMDIATHGQLRIVWLYFLLVLATYFSRNPKASIIVGSVAILAVLAAVILNGQFTGALNFASIAITLAGLAFTMFFVRYLLFINEQADKDTKQVKSMFTHATEGIILTNRNREILLVNPFAERMFGYAADELEGSRIEILLPEQVRARHEGHVEKFHVHPMNRSMGAGRDLYARRKDGSVFPVEISLSHYNSGKESYVIAFIIDITIRKQGEEMLKQKNEELETISSKIKQLNTELEQKVEDRTMMLRETLEQLERSKNELAESLEKEKELGDLKSRFVSTVSHEFRTPLSTILSSTALIGKYVREDEQDKRNRHINRIKEQVMHMNTMLEDLLVLGRLEEGRMDVNAESFDLDDFLADFTAEMQTVAKKGQRIVTDKHFGGLITTDKRLLKNILINLVSNAIKFSPDEADIQLVTQSEDNDLKLTVKDKGIGINETDRQHLFERFFRGHNAQNIQGTGLGLHIVSKYLELLAGNIQLESETGKGSSFTVTLPSVISTAS